MSNALTEVLDLVEHFVNTHTHWNLDMSQVEAKAKIQAARLMAIAESVKPDVEEVVGDVKETVADVKKTVTDAKDAAK